MSAHRLASRRPRPRRRLPVRPAPAVLFGLVILFVLLAMLAVWFMTWPRTTALLVSLLWLMTALLMLVGVGACRAFCCVLAGCCSAAMLLRGNAATAPPTARPLLTHALPLPCPSRAPSPAHCRRPAERRGGGERRCLPLHRELCGGLRPPQDGRPALRPRRRGHGELVWWTSPLAGRKAGRSTPTSADCPSPLSLFSPCPPPFQLFIVHSQIKYYLNSTDQTTEIVRALLQPPACLPALLRLRWPRRAPASAPLLLPGVPSPRPRPAALPAVCPPHMSRLPTFPATRARSWAPLRRMQM